MVNHGRSAGCVTCKQRRVKCDETKPQCRLCQRLGLRCGGYKVNKPARLKFKNQNHKFQCHTASTAVSVSQAVGSPDSGSSSTSRAESVAVPSPRALAVAEPDTSVPFFLTHYARSDMESARGFFEVLIPVYHSQRQNSPLSLAVSVVASEVLSLWRHGAGGVQPQHKSYGQAIACLRDAIGDSLERRKPETLLAILALQLYENITAVYGIRSPTRIHHNGAVSLLPFAESDENNKAIGAYVRKFILHTEVSSAMRQGRPVQSVAYSLIQSRDTVAAPDNPSSTLDVIGASVAELQARYTSLATDGRFPCLPQRALREWRAETKRIDERLLAWARSLPDGWEPLKLTAGQDFSSSIPTYQSTCEAYPSCQIANIWNLWRCQRLLLVKIALISLDTIMNISQSELSPDQLSTIVDDFDACKQTLQGLVDSVCYSVPFYVGNRARLSSMADFTDPTILFPSYHSMTGGEKCLDQNNKAPGTSPDVHRRHVIAQGPWHIMSPLSYLLTLLSGDFQQLAPGLIDPEQHQWIREQFLRATALIHLLPPQYDDVDDRFHTFKSWDQCYLDIRADYLAKSVRKGAIFMSGP